MNTVRHFHPLIGEILTEMTNKGDDFDAGRGGWGQMKTREEIEQERQDEQDDLYRTDGGKEVPSGAGRDEHDDEVSFSLLVVPYSPMEVL